MSPMVPNFFPLDTSTTSLIWNSEILIICPSPPFVFYYNMYDGKAGKQTNSFSYLQFT
jgi:hypothetical protein